MKPLILALLAALPAGAEPPTAEALEGPIWIEPVLPKAVLSGAMGALFPTLRFEDGVVEEGMFYGGRLVLPEGCADPADCPAPSEREGVFREGPYRIEGEALTAETAPTGRVFERPGTEALLRDIAPFGGVAPLPARIEGGVLTLGPPGEARRWLALEPAVLEGVRAVIAAGGFSMRALGACSIRAAHRRAVASDLSERDRGLDALLAVTLRIERLSNWRGALGTDAATVMVLPEAERALVRDMTLHRMALTAALRAVVADPGADPMLAARGVPLEGMSDAGRAVLAEIRADEWLLRRAAEAGRALDAAQFDPEAARAVLCD